MPKVGGGLLAVLCDPAPGQESALEDWYEHQHLYERSAIEGFFYSRRYLSVQGQPKSLALYEISGTDVLHGEAYQGALRNERQAREAQGPEARRQRTINSVRNEYELLDSTGRHPGEIGAFVWLVREETTGAEHDEELRAWYRKELMPAVAGVPGVRGIKRYTASVGSPKYLTMYELATADIVESEAWKKAFRSPAAERIRPYLTNVSTNLAQFWKVVFQDEARREVATWPKHF
jgi:hypothetical protein